VFDGDRNVEVPYLLQCTMNDVLAEELHKTKREEDYMTNTFLVMQRYAAYIVWSPVCGAKGSRAETAPKKYDDAPDVTRRGLQKKIHHNLDNLIAFCSVLSFLFVL